jgi:hypothetical protein
MLKFLGGGLGGYSVNATFNNISVISWRSVLLVEETGVLGENLPKVTDKLYHTFLDGGDYSLSLI